MIYVHLLNKSGLPEPEFAKAGDAGMDVRISEDRRIPPGGTELLPTGLFMGIPSGYEIQVRPRSGMSYKTKMRIANSPGTIDSNYKGELMIIADNIGTDDILFHRGDRVAQITLEEKPRWKFIQVFTEEQLGSSNRGSDGFGSTGIN